MNSRTFNGTPLAYARFAGFLYLLIICLGVSSELLVRSQLVVPDDATQTANNILNASGLFHLGWVADTIMLICDVAIAVLFYQLFKPVNRPLALMATVFRLTQAAILGFNLLNYYAAWLILSGVTLVTGFQVQQTHALALLFLNLHSYGYDLGLLFFGVSNLILGYLIMKSDLLPRVLGVGLIAAGVVYLLGGFVRFIWPESMSWVEPMYLIPLIAESAFCLWLLIKGVKSTRPGHFYE